MNAVYYFNFVLFHYPYFCEYATGQYLSLTFVVRVFTFKASLLSAICSVRRSRRSCFFCLGVKAGLRLQAGCREGWNQADPDLPIRPATNLRLLAIWGQSLPGGSSTDFGHKFYYRGYETSTSTVQLHEFWVFGSCVPVCFDLCSSAPFASLQDAFCRDFSVYYMKLCMGPANKIGPCRSLHGLTDEMISIQFPPARHFCLKHGTKYSIEKWRNKTRSFRSSVLWEVVFSKSPSLGAAHWDAFSSLSEAN